MSYFSTQPQPKHRHTLRKTRTRWYNQRNCFNPIKMEWYNTQDRDTTDFNKIDIVKPIPKWLCMGTLKEYMYCKFNALHPSATPSDWSSKDWDSNKAKGREQWSLLKFKLLEQQLQKTLQNRTKDSPQGEDRRDKPTVTLTYEMTDQEIWLWHEEEKYGIYMSTFGYEGDNSNLDSKMDSDSNVTAYPSLE